jgi:hypothetical protein
MGKKSTRICRITQIVIAVIFFYPISGSSQDIFKSIEKTVNKAVKPITNTNSNTNTKSTSETLYQTVQGIYAGSTNLGSNCNAVKDAYNRLEQYKNSSQPVPATAAYSVRYPNQVSNPSIGQLANDRQIRIRMQYESCFIVRTRGDDLYDAVQNIYGQYQHVPQSDCNAVNRMINQLEGYRNYYDAVPDRFAYTVSFPSKVNNPKISDLALDRQERLRSQYKSCFTESLSPDLLATLPGIWNFSLDGSDYQMNIINRNGIQASFNKQGYSYPPQYLGYEAIQNNGVRLKFQLAGGQYQLTYDLWASNNQLSGQVLESWKGTPKQINLQNQNYRPSVPQPTSIDWNSFRFTAGFTGAYYSNLTSYYNGGYATVTKYDEAIDFDWGTGQPHSTVPADNFMINWKAVLKVPVSGNYTIMAHSDDGVQVSVNGNSLIDAWVDQGPTWYEKSIYLEAGTPYQLNTLYYERGGGAVIHLYIRGPGFDAARLLK